MECEACGSRNVARREIEGALVHECGLCGALEGEPDDVRRIEELRAGRERGYADAVIPLVAALEEPGFFRIVQAAPGEPSRGEAPMILFALCDRDATPLERLLKSVEMANRETKLRWLIELSLQHGVVYILRPRFWKQPAEITAAEVRLARGDLAVLAQRLRRDLSLSWWRE